MCSPAPWTTVTVVTGNLFQGKVEWDLRVETLSQQTESEALQVLLELQTAGGCRLMLGRKEATRTFQHHGPGY